jgi:hypothetical protein
MQRSAFCEQCSFELRPVAGQGDEQAVLALGYPRLSATLGRRVGAPLQDHRATRRQRRQVRRCSSDEVVICCPNRLVHAALSTLTTASGK